MRLFKRSRKESNATPVTSAARRQRRIRRVVTQILEARQLLSTATFVPPTTTVAFPGAIEIELVDVNADGNLDLLGLTPKNRINPATLSVSLGRGDGTFNTLPGTYAVGTTASDGAVAAVIEAGDMNRDGKIDVVAVVGDDAAVYVLNGNGNGTFAQAVRAPLTGLDGLSPSDVAIGDFNQDGNPEAAVSSRSSDKLVLMVWNGAALPQTFRTVTLPHNGGLLSVLDFDRDGRLDIGVASNSVTILHNINLAAGTASTQTNTGLGTGKTLNGSAAGFFRGPSNRPGVVLAFVNLSPQGSVVLLPDPMQQQTGTASNVGNALLGQAAAADLNADGFDDVVVGVATSPNVLVYMSNGDGTLAAPTNYTVNRNSRGVAIGDVNNDGRPDIVFSDGSVSVMLAATPSLVVTTTIDENDNTSAPAAGAGTSLREALDYAASKPGPDTIELSPSVFNSRQTISLLASLGELRIFDRDGVTIVAPNGLILDAGGNSRVLQNVADSRLTLNGVTIRNGRDPGEFSAGGGIRNQGDLTLVNSLLTGNNARFGSALASYVGGTLTMRNVTITGNGASTSDFVVYIDGGTNSNLTHVTIAGNTAAATGGTILSAGNLTLNNSVIVGHPTADILTGTATPSGMTNFIGTGAVPGLSATRTGNPALATLADNGGPTQTILPVINSPLVDAAVSAGVATDARGIARPQLLAPDIGATEARFVDFNVPSVITPEGVTWYLFNPIGNDFRVYRQVPGFEPTEVGGAGTSIALLNDGNVIIRDSGGVPYVREGSAYSIGSGWVNRPFVNAPDGATWLLGTDGSGDNRNIYRWAAAGTPQLAFGEGTRLAVFNNTVVTINAAGEVYRRLNSQNGLGTVWRQQASTRGTNNSIWFIFTDVAGGTGEVIRWGTDSFFFNIGQILVSQVSREAGGTILARNDSGTIFRREESNLNFGTTWLTVNRVATADAASWFLGSELANANYRIYRWASNSGSVAEVGGNAVALAIQPDGNVVVRDAARGVFIRISSANSIGTEWRSRSSIAAGDGATWFLGTDGAGADFNIFRWTATGTPQFANATATRLVAVNGFAIAQSATGTVSLRVGSNFGFGSQWIAQSHATATDGAVWFVGVTSLGAEGPIFRWATDGAASTTGGIGREMARESGGTIVTRQANGTIFSKPGSANGLGGNWTQRPRVSAGDNATWFLGTESTIADQRIYRWASNSGTATEVGGQGTALALQADGSVLVRDSARVPYHRPGSASGIGSNWAALPYVITADSATWFVSTEPVRSDRAIYRWVGSNAPANTTGAGLSLVISPNGDVSATNNIGQVFQAIGSSSGFSSNWRLITNSLVVTTILDENDFTSSANFGNGTSLREAIDFANANPGADTISFLPSLVASGQAVQLAFGATGGGDDSALRILSDLTINGGGATINYVGTAGRRHFASFAGTTLTLRDLTLSGGNTAGVNDGGAVWTSGNVAIENVRFTGNTANRGGALHVFTGGIATITNGQFDNNTATASGGAIDNAGELTITGSRFTSNTGGEGGAIQSTGTLNISTSTFTGNASGFNGGALRLFGTTTIDRSTFDANIVANEGGALISFGGLAVTNSTFANNGKNAVLLWDGTANLDHVTIAYNTNGGLLRVNATTTLRNSIVAGNAGFDQSGTLAATSSNNLLNVSAGAARLGSLLNHGGPTSTIELLPGSPAINAGLALNSTDQRGVARPQGAASDLGAYERAAISAQLTSASYEFLTRQALTLNFDGDASVVFGRSSVTLTNLTTIETINAGTLNWNADGTRATLDLTNQLADGRYRLQEGSTTLEFDVFAGDFNRDLTVNFDDLLILAANYNQSGKDNGQGDATYDGTVNFDDLLKLAANYNRTLAGAGPALLLTPPAPGGFVPGSSDEDGPDGRGDEVLA